MKKVRGWGKSVLHQISLSSSDSSMQDARSQASREQVSSPQSQVNEEVVPVKVQEEETGIWLTPVEMEKLEELCDREFIHTKVISLDFSEA